MKVYRIDIMVIDHDDVGAEEIKDVIESHSFPNPYPQTSLNVMKVEEREIGEWDDDNPLNFISKRNEAFQKLFRD